MKLIANLAEIDRRAVQEHGIPAEHLMENAGAAVAETLRQIAQPDQRIVILCGPGNNGGDGFVVTRLLHQHGYGKLSCLYTGRSYRNEALTNLEKLLGLPVEMIQAEEQPALAKSRIENALWIVDGLFGSGLARPVQGIEADFIQLTNRCRQAGNLNGRHPTVLAIDIPSGVNGATGDVLGRAIEADVTITFGTAKPGLYLHPGKSHSGQVQIVDIGLPEALLTEDKSPIQLIEETLALEWLPKRPVGGHKYSFGHVLIVGGSRSMPGAISLMSHAALSAGAGVVTVAAPQSAFQNTPFWPELLRLSLPENSDGCLTEAAWWPVMHYIEEKQVDVIGIGPGLGLHSDTVQFVWKLLSELTRVPHPLPLIVDADALNALSLVDDVEYLRDVQRPGIQLHPQAILTPHIGGSLATNEGG